MSQITLIYHQKGNNIQWEFLENYIHESVFFSIYRFQLTTTLIFVHVSGLVIKMVI